MGKGFSAVVKAVDFVERHLGGESTLDAAAAKADYSKYHLHRLFARTVGMTMHDYLKRRRLTEAAKLLALSGTPIVDIALQVGYGSQQAFSSAFKELYKKSPREFRVEGFYYPLQLRFRPVEPSGSARGRDRERPVVERASPSDVPEWMRLVDSAIDGFPRLDESRYETCLKEGIGKGRAVVMRERGHAIGAMIFRSEIGSIDFLAIHPQYRGSGAERSFLGWIAAGLDSAMDISITTYREGDKADTGHRETIKRLGFSEAELRVEYGYPTQRFALRLDAARGGRA